MLKLLLIAVAGGIGTLARYGVAVLLGDAVHRANFPLNTLMVNLIGCFGIGLLFGLLVERWPLREEYRLAVIVGLLGGFTTFSTFGWETLTMLRQGYTLRAAVYVLASNVLGVLLVMLGYALSRQEPT